MRPVGSVVQKRGGCKALVETQAAAPCTTALCTKKPTVLIPATAATAGTVAIKPANCRTCWPRGNCHRVADFSGPVNSDMPAAPVESAAHGCGLGEKSFFAERLFNRSHARWRALQRM